MLVGARSSLKMFAIVFALQGLVVSFAHAKDLNAVALYRRCYVHLTGETPALNDANLPAIRNGTKDPIRTCLDLLDAADIDPNDSEGKLKSPANETSLKILNNLYELQLTFVKNKVPATSNFLEDFASTDDIYDHTAVG